MRSYKLLFLFLAAAAPAVALGQTTNATGGPLPVTGNVPALCAGGTTLGGSSSYDLGVLIDTSTGLLRSSITPAAKTVSGAFCSARSTISVSATPLVAQNMSAAPPMGFSRTVHYRATASGWTPNPAIFNTGGAANTAATQERGTAFQGDISVSIADFTTGGGDTLRLVADTAYQGIVTVTLAVQN